MIKAIIFDFDGVIGNTYDINFEVSKIFDSNMTEQDFIDHHKGNVFEEPKIKFKPEEIPVFFEKQKQKFTPEHFFPLEKILGKLKKEFQLFVISSTIDENIKYFLEIGHYDHFFQKILGATTHRSKVEKFKTIFSQYDLKAEECLFITDTIGDIIEARKVNIKTIGVTWGYHRKELLFEQKPFAIVDNAEELLNVINNLCNE
ncbi:MAG: HAD-IA family hydrolase [Patescibacteria group bacterium]|nr:HAD-IA family hydrolase [Patescibacteria group bacterium]